MGQDAQLRRRSDERSHETAAVDARQREAPSKDDDGVASITHLALAAPDAVRDRVLTPASVLELQRRAGNAAVGSMLTAASRTRARRPSALLLQRRVRAASKAAAVRRTTHIAAQRAPSSAGTATAPPQEVEGEEEEVDTSEFTDDPKAAAAKLAEMPKPPPPPPPPALPAPPAGAAKPQVAAKKAPPLKKAAPPAKKVVAVKKGAAKATKAAPGEIVKKPAPPLPPAYVFKAGAAYLPPVQGKPLKPKADPAFKKVALATQETIKAAKRHPKGKQEADNAQGEAKAPPNDKQWQAEANRLDDMGKAKPAKFDEEAFILAVEEKIRAAAPKNLNEAGNVDKKAEGVKGALKGELETTKERAAGDVEKKAAEPPDLGKVSEKPVVKAPPLQIEQPGGLKASGAMPAPVPNEQIDLRSGPAGVDQEMAENEVTEEQLQESNEPEFVEAVESKKVAEEHSKKAPADVRKVEGTILKKAAADSAGLEKSTVAGSKEAIAAKVAGVNTQKTDTISKDEAKRKEVADTINGTFAKTKADVDGILEGLEKSVDERFTKGEAAIREAFTYDWNTRLDQYKDRRYSGIRGPFRWGRDKFRGLPSEANKLFEASRQMYESMMKKLVKSIATMVSTELNKATARIEQGRQEVDTYVKSLKGDLAKFGAEAAADIQDKFTDLDSSVQDKFTDMVDGISRRYQESTSAVDEEIKKAKEANQGLIDKAIGKLRGAYNAIKNLKDLLFRVFAKIVDVVGRIIRSPVKFIGNFFSAVKEGVTRFRDKIEDHLQEGLMKWLLGKLGAAGIEIPKTFDLESMMKLVLSVAGVSWGFVREKIAKRVGEPAMSAVEGAVSLVDKLKGGPAAMWDLVAEKFDGFKDMVIDKIKEIVVEKVVKAGISFLISMLTPAGAFIKACQTIYNVVMFFVEKAKDLGEFIESIVDAAGEIARGGKAGVPEKIENVLARALPLAIGFLANLVGLGGIGDRVRELIQRVRTPIERVIDKIVTTVVKLAQPAINKAKALYAKGKAVYDKGKQKVVDAGTWVADKGRAAAKRVRDVGVKAKDKIVGLFKPQSESFDMSGAGHTLKAIPKGRSFEMRMASEEGPLVGKLKKAIAQRETRMEGEAPEQAAKTAREIADLKAILASAINLEADFDTSVEPTTVGAPPGFTSKMKRVSSWLTTFAKKTGKTDILSADADTQVDLRLLPQFGLPVASFLQAQEAVDASGQYIQIRPTNVSAPKALEAGMLPKPEQIKAKTIDEDDVLLGAPKKHLGKPALFLPREVKAEDFGDPETFQRASRRAKEREQEYGDTMAVDKKFVDLLRAGSLALIDGDKMNVEQGGVIIETARKLAYTGDHDLFRIAGNKQKIIDDLTPAPFRVQHGAHLDWPDLIADIAEPAEKKRQTGIFNSVVRKHVFGGDKSKALLQVNKHAPPTTAYANLDQLLPDEGPAKRQPPDGVTIVEAEPPAPSGPQETNAPPPMTVETSSLQHAFKHKDDFGFAGVNWNKDNGAKFEAALRAHVDRSRHIVGTYRGSPVLIHLDDASGVVVITTRDGALISGWKLNAQQLHYVTTKGSL